MLEHTREFIAERTEHPLFASLFIMAAVLVGIGFYLDATGSEVWGAFMIIFAGMFTIVGLLGYIGSYTAKFIASYRERSSSI